MKKIIVAITLITTVCLSSFAAPMKQPTVAVLPFRVGGNMTVTNVGSLQITRKIVENEFTNQLIQFLVKSRKFNVLNRQDIRSIMDENKLTESDWAKPGQEKYIGKLLVADYLVTGNINRLEFRVIRQNIKITGETKPRIVATLKTQYKVTEVKSGKIVASGQVKQVLKSIDVRNEIPIQVRKDWTLSDYKDLLFNKAVVQVGDDILAGIYPVKVASVSGKTLTLNRGKGAGVKSGQKYIVYNPGKEIVDPDTREVLGSSEIKIATIVVTSVNPKFSTAKIESTTGVILPGAICRLEKQKVEEEEPAYPRATPGW